MLHIGERVRFIHSNFHGRWPIRDKYLGKYGTITNYETDAEGNDWYMITFSNNDSWYFMAKELKTSIWR